MDGVVVWHFTSSGLVQPICGSKEDVALRYNIEADEGLFFDKPEQARCPSLREDLAQAGE